MKQINLNDVQKYVEDNIGTFHSKRLQNLEKLKLKLILGSSGSTNHEPIGS
jgi:hypothetical protein